jgi:lipopolysaccharide transport system permease protein
LSVDLGMRRMFGDLYRHRWLIRELVVRDVILRYRGSALGFVWTLLTPLFFILVYMLVFSVFLQVGVPNYPVFLVAGLLPWQWFSTALQAGTTSLVDGRMYVGKAVLPPVLFVLVPVLSNFIHFVLSLPILLAVGLIFRIHVIWPLLTLPLLLAIQLLLTIAILLFVAPFNVFYRDASQLVSVILMLAFYLTPIIYPLTNIPPHFRLFTLANPMTALVLSYQNIFYFQSFPDWRLVAYTLGVSLALLLAGRLVFDRYKDSFAEYV